MKVVTVTDAVRAERGIQSDHGALIYDIPDEMQRATGLRSGDVVLQINRTKIAGAEDLRRAFSTAAGLLQINRTKIAGAEDLRRAFSTAAAGGAGTVWFERGGRLARTAFYGRYTCVTAPAR